ncbi:Uncharacterized protein, UPF0305 family [Methanolobus profundi]|uniref:UPF0305 protein SAMN04488696_0848 n=2 Tax=Methanolobus profundi TaxID=487685 RepID=A0A1I4PSS8_9EURY|nr:Uncharacterized protein, UPF0305 family [Methanolobus profundi]
MKRCFLGSVLRGTYSIHEAISLKDIHMQTLEVFHINSHELLLMLKKEAESLSYEHLISTSENEADSIQSLPGSPRYNIEYLVRYNHRKFSELKERDCTDLSEEIDIGQLDDLTFRISKYMDTYAPGQSDLKEYIRIISTYLTFVVKEPLHPPGMYVTEDQMIFENNGVYYCPVKSKHISEEMSLCKYCVCRTS